MEMIKNLTIPHTYVLVKMMRSNDEIFIGDFKAWLNTNFEQEKHQSVFGEVVKVPENLFFLGSADQARYNPKCMPWECEMELQVGDKVVIDYIEAQTAMGEGHNNKANPRFLVDYSRQDKEWYCFIPYQHCLVAVRDEEIIPLNGNILAEPELENGKYSERICELKHVGKKVVRYAKTGEYAKSEETRKELRKGMRVFLERYNNRWLEFSLHQNLGKYYVFKSCDIEAVLEKDSSFVVQV